MGDISDITVQKRTELRDNVLRLAVACPVERCNPVDCPLFPVRQMELEPRLQWFGTLSDDDLIFLNAYHFVCMKTKLELLSREKCGCRSQPS